MSTCCWCTPGGASTVAFLQRYAAQTALCNEFQTANEDLCYCLECVVEYHKARDELPLLHEVLWELEIARLTRHFEKCMNAESDDDDDELFIVDSSGEAQLFDFTGQDFENKLRVPLLEILKFPYLLLDEHVNDLCVEALCRMEQANCSFQVFEKHPGIYLFLVHPNEMVRRWAILTARSLGKVDRDDYYDLQEVLTCLFKVIELGLLECPEIYASAVLQKGKLVLLPTHMYDVANYKNYWLGICMLLTVLEEQAMESLLLGSNKQNDFMQSILHAMDRCTDDERMDPFWPALHCFMVILDRLGSKVWGQLIDPIEAFQTIINNMSYNREIQTIRKSSAKAKFEPDTCSDDMVTCSQIVYSYNPEKTKKDSGWRSAICPDYCPNMYEEMETLTSVLQSDIGQDMRVHNSTFLWFIPFVQSLMDLKDLGMAYIVEVIHHLYSEVKDVLNQTIATCDKVTEFFLLILVSVIELHRSKRCLHLLWVSSQKWVEAVVKCAKLPTSAFTRTTEKSASSCPRGSPVISTLSLHTTQANSVQLACVQLIRSLLKEGYQLGQQTPCKQFWDKLNLFLRGSPSLGWQLSAQETHELQMCLKQIIRNIRPPLCSALGELQSSRASGGRDGSEDMEKPKGDGPQRERPSPTAPKEPMRVEGCQVHEGASTRPPEAAENEPQAARLEDRLSGEPPPKQIRENASPEDAPELVQVSPPERKCLRDDSSCTGASCASRGPREHSDKGTLTATLPVAAPSSHALAKKPLPSEELCFGNSTLGRTVLVTQAQKDRICAKLSHVIRQRHRNSIVGGDSISLEETATACDLSSRKGPGNPRGSEDFPRDLLLGPRGLAGAKVGARQCPGASVLVKKPPPQHEDFDVLASDGSGCQARACDDSRDLASLAGVTSRLVRKTSTLEEPVIIHDSQEAACGTPSRGAMLDLLDQPLNLSPKSDRLTDSQLDQDLHDLSLLAQASVTKFPSESSQRSPCQRQGKIREDKRCPPERASAAQDTGHGQIIVISDSEDDEDNGILSLETPPKADPVGSEPKGPDPPISAVNLSVAEEAPQEDPTEYLLEFEDSDSQFFEFESPCEVFSVWQDQSPDSPVLEGEENFSLCHGAEDPDEQVQAAGAGAGGDLIVVSEGDGESPEQATEISEVEVKKPKRKRTGRASAGKSRKPPSPFGNKDPSDDPPEAGQPAEAGERPQTAPSTSGVSRATKKAPPAARTASKPARRRPAPKRTKKWPAKAHYLKCRAVPAVVPPRKFRRFPEPASVPEKLGLKKAPRQAPIDLSQQSRDTLSKLRDYGKVAGAVEIRKKTKLIPPQMLSVRNNKKLLTMQEPRMRRQVKANAHKLGTANRVAGRHIGPGAQASGPAPVRASSRAKTDLFIEVLGKPLLRVNPVNSRAAAAMLDGGLGPADTAVEPAAGLISQHVGAAAATRQAEPDSSSDVEDDHLFLTQRDPQDMDLCSQMGGDLSAIDDGAQGEDAAAQTSTAPAAPPSEPPRGPKCKHKDCGELAEDQSEFCSEHSEAAAKADVFCKPALPPRPSTTKVFSSTSRQANLSKSMQSSAAALRPAKNKAKGAPPVPKAMPPLPPPLKVLPTLPPPPPAPMETLSEVKGPRSVLFSPVSTVVTRSSFRPPFAENRPLSTTPPATVLSSQAIADTFIKEVLKWKYDMFLNFSQCGPPASLCQVKRHVPVRFQNAGEYFNVFFPLVMLNTFESVAQEWSNSPSKYYYSLLFRKFPTEYKKYWEFMVHLDESELSKQLHPKENDLVFLLPERRSAERKSAERVRAAEPSDHYCGFVHKFRRTPVMRSGKFECFLSIQTQDRLPINVNEFVRCMVISSLVTTQRKLKAMSLLSGRNQLARAILNPNPMDFCTKDLLTTNSERIQHEADLGLIPGIPYGPLSTARNDFQALPGVTQKAKKKKMSLLRESTQVERTKINYLRDFNEEQKKAIETAYAMVKHPPSVAKVCLIHGPPGTGKSKTIVGLLYRLLTETQRRGRSDENSNAKIKQNRVLVCAPSNAAVDELMKKIILEFKTKCRDRRSPLGNCGDINLVRLGPEKSINAEVLKFSLDSQVNHRMKKDLPSHVQDMHRRKEFLDCQLDELSRQRALCRRAKEVQRQRQELDEKIASVSKERQELASKIKEVQGRPQKTQSLVILESHVICCTLSTSGGLLLESAFRGQGGMPFSCVIVDEAGQSCEVETLTPLIHRCNKLILVGDPKQLPPTVISMKAQEYGYNQSMMARFYKLLEEKVEQNLLGRLPVVQLSVQYRMHPDICLFPSNYIYGRNLKTNRATETSRCSSDWPFQPYIVFDVEDGAERRDNDSYVNVQEIKLVMEIMKLIREKRKEATSRNIGIITHYKAQKMMIQRELDREFDRKGLAEVDTVDAFQGRQKDCIIVTCVRANSAQGSIGFLSSLQRLNVAITRAKYSLFILGHLSTLMDNPHWNELIQDAQRRGAIVRTCDRSYRHDVLKILKLKAAPLQRSASHPPAVTPEAARPQGGLPSTALEGSPPSMSSPYLTPPDSGEPTVPAKDPEKSLVQDQLRDPRLLRRLGISLEAREAVVGVPRPQSPQPPRASSALGEPASLVGLPELGSLLLSSHSPLDTLSHRELRPSGAEGVRAASSGSSFPQRAAGWDKRQLGEGGSYSKRRKLL